MKVDIHTNLEWFPTSQSSDTRIYASVDDTVEFLRSNGVTVNFCMYPRDEYHRLEELVSKSPEIKHIGVQVLMGRDADDATDMSMLKLDVNDPDKSFTNGGHCYGIKIASHRGFWKRSKEVYEAHRDITGKNTGLFKRVEEEVRTSGFDYGRGDSRTLTKWIRSMPDNSIVSMHMQGDSIYNSASIPTTVGSYAYKNPSKKFIINHCGDFGQGGMSNKPKNYKTITKKGEENFFPAFRHAHSKGTIDSAVHLANDLHNVLLDTSVYTPFKGEMMKDCRRWAIGSDYPFQVKDTSKGSNLFIKEENKFIRDLGEKAVEECHKSSYNWLVDDWRTLMKRQEEIY